MVRAKAAAAKRPKNKPYVEELYFRSDSAYLCLILNRRTRSIRVVDFRAGALPAKRLYIQSVATQENVEKVITLVEKDEVSSWTRVGFVREGTIPGFYKRSDGHLCGCVIGDKRAAKDIPDNIKGASVRAASEKDALAARDALWRKGPAFGSFDMFGRDAERMYFDVSYRRSKTNYLSAEFQDCFGHALVEILRLPTSENEMLAVTAGLRAIGDDLEARGIVAAFAFAPYDNLETATAFIASGYRKTGLLAKALLSEDGTRKDAILLTRKLANAADEGYE